MLIAARAKCRRRATARSDSGCLTAVGRLQTLIKIGLF